jgi:peptide/nickel transport system substrate-binding protein
MQMRLVLAAVLVLSACQVPPVPGVSTPTPTPAGTVETGGTLRVALTADATTLDPWNANDTNTMLVTRQIFETLVDYDAGGFKIVPKLAESWSVSPEGRSWTFALRRGVKFHDGTDLDAAAVVLNFDRARQAAHPLRGPAGPGSSYRAYAALLEGFDDASVIVRAEAKDAATVVITTKMPFGPLLADLAMPSFAIVSPKSMRGDPAGWSMPASRGAAGTGPFVFRSGAWQPGQQIALERNAEYWTKDQAGMALPHVDRVVLRVTRDETARIAELRSGGLDAVRDVTPLTLPAVRGDPNLQLLVRGAATATYLGVGAVAPFDKVEVRRAIAMAIDKSLLATTLFSGAGRPASQLFPPGMLGYDDSVVEFYRLDIAGAKRLLADAGVASGLTTELWYPSAWRAYYPDPKRVAESIAADLAKIGIVATVRTEDAAAYLADARAGRLPLWLGDAGGDSADPDSYFPDSGAWAGDVVRELLRRARYEADASKRTELYKQVSKIIQQDATRIPLVQTDALVATTKKVRGLVPHPIGVEAYTLVWLGK